MKSEMISTLAALVNEAMVMGRVPFGDGLV
jgi:hypothetical protein